MVVAALLLPSLALFFIPHGLSDHSPREITMYNLKWPAVDLINKMYLIMWHWHSMECIIFLDGKFSSFTGMSIMHVYIVKQDNICPCSYTHIHASGNASDFWDSKGTSIIPFSSLQLKPEGQVNVQ